MMSSRMLGATVPAVPANSQNVMTPRTMPNSSLSLPWNGFDWVGADVALMFQFSFAR